MDAARIQYLNNWMYDIIIQLLQLEASGKKQHIFICYCCGFKPSHQLGAISHDLLLPLHQNLFFPGNYLACTTCMSGMIRMMIYTPFVMDANEFRVFTHYLNSGILAAIASRGYQVEKDSLYREMYLKQEWVEVWPILPKLT